MINTDPGPLFAWITGVLIIALGIFVVGARPKKGANRAFFIFALGLGGQAVWFNMQVGQPPYFGQLFWPVFGGWMAIMTLGAVLLARSSLIGAAGISRRTFALAFGGCAAVVVPVWVVTSIDPLYAGAALGVQPAQATGFLAAIIPFAASMAANAGLGCVAAMRARLDPDKAGAMAAITIAALGWPAVQTALMLSIRAPIYGWPFVGLLLVAAGWWLAFVKGAAAKNARRVATIPLTLALGGYILTLFFEDPLALVTAGYFGLARMATVGIFAFAIVRHQILGFDIKVRRGIKGSTLAALFFAVFFVVSETTAQVLGETDTGPFVGIAVAGVLVFFLAPLQRWADRLAGAATGHAKPLDQTTDDEKTALYRRTAFAAWAEGAIDRRERALLNELPAGLGLSREAAGAIEDEAAGTAP